MVANRLAGGILGAGSGRTVGDILGRHPSTYTPSVHGAGVTAEGNRHLDVGRRVARLLPHMRASGRFCRLGLSAILAAMTSAEDPPVPAPRWVSFAEAQRILKMTEGTLRRAIKAGTVQGEQRRRNPDSPTDQRMVYEVLVSDAPAVAAPAAPIEASSATEPATIAPDATMRALDIMETLLRANGEAMERQAEQITRLHELVWQAEHDKAAAEARAKTSEQTLRDQAETLRATEARAAKLAADLERERGRPWWRKMLGRE
jgi:hypothetical protein